MSNFLIGIVGIIYLGVAISEFRAGHLGFCLAFISYAFANVGLILANQSN